MVTGTGLAPVSAGQVPGVGGAVVTGEPRHARETLALARRSLAHTLLTGGTLAPLRTQEVTGALWRGGGRSRGEEQGGGAGGRSRGKEQGGGAGRKGG